MNLDKKVLFYLSELPIVDNYHTHMVKLTGVLDQIGSITTLKNQNIDLKIIDLVKRTKSLSVVKTSLDKLHHEAIRSQTAGADLKKTFFYSENTLKLDHFINLINETLNDLALWNDPRKTMFGEIDFR